MDRKSTTTRSELKSILSDEKAEPNAMSLSLLEEITNSFSWEEEIGRGGFAVVYKGMLDNGTAVAVKKLSNTYMYEKQFHREIECLIKVKHKNVVRFIGYCSDSQGKAESYNGKFVMADVQQRLLCFEYLPHGTLDKYITDASYGLDWTARYNIIYGICDGLHYLHQNQILHMDLKPPNILLDGNMLPKITDFGLSRCFNERQSRAITTKIGGTMGYLAPEFGSREITYRFDLYSLGVIIIEILTGKKGYEAVEDVLESWRNRLEESHKDIQLEQIQVCTVIAIECMEFNPAKRPASTDHIIARLHEIGNIEGSIKTVVTKSSALQIKSHNSEMQSVNNKGLVEELEKLVEQLRNADFIRGEDNAQRALAYISQICQKNGAKNLVRNQGIIPALADLLKSSSRRVRLKSLQVLRTVVEDNDQNKEELGKGDTVSTIIKFLSNEHIQERELAVSLLYELSEYEPVCERIGAVYGAILLLVGMGSSKSETMMAVDKAEKTLKNLEKYDTNIKQMAENGRLQPLLTKLLQGGPEVQVTMAEYLGELALANDVKVVVAEQVGALLVSIIKTGGLPAREATLKALREMSSNESSAKILLQAGILPPLVRDLFSVGASSHFPMRLKEVSATILANLVASGASFRSIPIDDAGRQTLLSEDVVHSLLNLISNTGPAVECKLLNVLVGLTSSPDTTPDVVSAIKSSSATISLIQFLEAAHRDLRVESLKLLRNVSPYMGAELGDSLGGHLSSLVQVISEGGGGGVTEEQVAAVGLLGDLPERDSKLTRQLFKLGAFGMLSSKLAEPRWGAIRGNRYTTLLTDGMVKVMYRLTCALQEAPEYVEFAREAALAPLFVELLQVIGQDTVQLYSAMALEKLSLETRNLTSIPKPPPPAASGRLRKFFFVGTSSTPVTASSQQAGVCRVHGGFCSLRDTFCLAERGAGGKAVEPLVACLDHLNPEVVEAALAALSTLVGDGVDAAEGVMVLGEGLRLVVDILVENRTEALQRRAVWVVEHILRVEDIAKEVAVDQTVASALVEAYRNGDARTRHSAECALRHLERIPDFSSAFHA